MMKPFRRNTLIVASALMLSSMAGARADITDLTTQLCEKIKGCAIKEMDAQGVTPDMRAMMQPMLDKMCVGIAQYTNDIQGDKSLQKPAEACLRSLNKLSCAQMQNGNMSNTQDCEEFRKRVEAADSNR